VPRFIPASNYHVANVKGLPRQALPKEAFDKFSPDVLGLGDISAASVPTDAIAAVFDLQGFTNFCTQTDPHLAVPKYLSSFLRWLMQNLRNEMRHSEHEADVLVYSKLPFFVKFLGDGLLVLWDCAQMGEGSQRNVIVSMFEVCRKYRSEFLPALKATMVDPPPILRCGVARGTVFSVGNGQDYVGSCINMAARLQKLPGLSFAFNRRGFNLEGPGVVHFFTGMITIRQVSIRGIGDRELIGILKSEAAKLSDENQKLYAEP
jgi:hypothetical protein